MAGESPDKSEQQKSSGTARSEGDPRLAVFREPASPAESGGKQDTATAVFRTKPVENGEDAEHAEGVEGTENASEGPGATSTPSGPAEPEEGDARLRAAVAAWVGKGDDDAAGAAAEEPEAADDADDAAKPETVAESDTPAPAEEAGESGTDSADATADEAAASSADAADAAEVADDAAEADADTHHDADDEAADKPAASGDAATTDADEDEPAVSGDASDETRVSEEREESHAAVSEGNKSAGDSEPAAADDAGDDAAEGADADDVDPAEDAGDAGDSEPAAADDADDDADDGAAKGAEATGGDVADPAEDTGDTDGTEPTADKRGIDQPTAVFKAIRRDRIDQPTTALKITRPSAKPEEKPEPESPAERTSQFVPLRRDGARPAPAPRKPETTGSAATPATRPSPAQDPAPSLSGAERTRQQPMPPRPPLDLLAELTNTPPPPETPVRTAVRRVKIWTPLVLLLLIAFAVVQAVRPLPAPTLVRSADPTYTFAGGKIDMPWPAEGQGVVEVEGVGTIGSYGKQKPMPIASVAKVMTAYVILKQHPITGKQVGKEIEVDKKAGEEANRPDESTAPIKEGQKYTQKQMLQLLMIPSGNNAARLLARWDATTEKAFVEKMNATAKDLGMTNTTYTDPSGLESSTVSTPADQLKLAEAVMQNDVFREIVNMPQADIPGVGKTIYNNNGILLEPGVSGIKTGSSTPAGGNLLWAADTVIDGKSRRIIGVVMGAQVDGTLDAKLQRAIQNSLKLIQTAQKGVDSATVVKKGDVVGYVDDGLGGKTPVIATKDLKAIGWGGLQVKLNIGEGDEQVPHSAASGTVVGEVTAGTGTGKVSAPVALQMDLAEPGFGAKLTRVG
ncbi:D-alanyl-D-alanine carboxypeptidase family protein [Streptomyces sp. NBC_01320]|uniref:D-alanyl-D-alanine carboxypeptidase family protein n=1 Tax=Streptomyces sp. NBC_01320 TaxID=2903824 RepID=UPI002E0E7FD8|nr:serine hydrolase [Streptomyces sp. NBC_01320]